MIVQVSKDIQGRLVDSLQRRNIWEQRQSVWYQMLKDGLNRRNKPFPGAANLHLPIADNAVEKIKPYDINAVFGRQQLASFTPLDQQLSDATTAASECLDWQLRKNSNYPKEYAYLRHLALGCGRTVMKVRWEQRDTRFPVGVSRDGLDGGDAQRPRPTGRLAFEAIDPLYFIAESESDSPDDMDLFCHIQQISVAKYRREKLYDQSLVQQLRGSENQADQWKGQEKDMREGLTSTSNKELIILWQAWERVEEGWLVHTFGPSRPDVAVRPDFLAPLKWQGEPMQPFVSVQCEITEKGWYASRGVVEKVAAFEAYGTKMWNQKADWLEYSGKPLFTRDAQSVIGNTNNIRLAPGDVLPPGLTPASIPEPPFSLDNEINEARTLAEESAQVPDFGVTDESKGAQGSRTATEMQYIGSFASQGIQYRAWINSLSEGEIYKRAWALLVQFGGKELTYFSQQTRKVLPAQALHDNYLIEPDQLPDAVSKENRIKREYARFQLLRGDPRIDQDRLYTRFISAEDPRLVKELLIPGKQKAASESEDEAMEIAILMEGYPAQAMPGEDHVTRLRMLYGKLQQLSMMPPPSTTGELSKAMLARTRLHQHIAAHMALLKQENPAVFKQFAAATAALDPSAGAAGGAAATALPGQQSVPPGDGPGGLIGGGLGGTIAQPALEGVA